MCHATIHRTADYRRLATHMYDRRGPSLPEIYARCSGMQRAMHIAQHAMQHTPYNAQLSAHSLQFAKHDLLCRKAYTAYCATCNAQNILAPMLQICIPCSDARGRELPFGIQRSRSSTPRSAWHGHDRSQCAQCRTVAHGWVRPDLARSCTRLWSAPAMAGFAIVPAGSGHVDVLVCVLARASAFIRTVEPPTARDALLNGTLSVTR